LAKLSFQVGQQTLPYRLKDEDIPLALKVPLGVADAIIFRKIRAITGGRLKFFVSGGAPLSKEIAEFFFQMGITIIEGYGLSETMILCVNRPGKIRFGTVGHPFKDTEFKIAEDGEILVRGPQIMKGYFGRPEQTAEVFTADGYFKTGDIGVVDEDGYLSITDRKKEIIITAAGKNIAPQPIENRIKAYPYVEQVCVIGDQKKYLTALIVPNLEICQGLLKSKAQKIPKDLSACCETKLVQEKFQAIVDEVNQELGRYATIKYFKLIPRAFSIEQNEMTPSMKLKRRVIQNNFRSEIDSMYPAEESPHLANG
jgi:long-chain acyl-CoA synthetase